MQYLVKREGCPLLDYGLVDMAAAKHQRLHAVLEETDQASKKCPLPLSMVDDYEVAWHVSSSVPEQARSRKSLGQMPGFESSLPGGQQMQGSGSRPIKQSTC